jgi:hypothetical protein
MIPDLCFDNPLEHSAAEVRKSGGRGPGRRVSEQIDRLKKRMMSMESRLGCRVVPVLVLGLICLTSVVSHSQDRPDLAGWGRDGEYNKLYDASEFDDFKGVVEDIMDITPLSGMAVGIGLKVKDQDGDPVEVHLGPKSFVKLDGIGLKIGDKVKIKGVWVALNDKDVFLASKVKKGENVELKVRRTKDGAPYWTFTPEELTREKDE